MIERQDYDSEEDFDIALAIEEEELGRMLEDDFFEEYGKWEYEKYTVDGSNERIDDVER